MLSLFSSPRRALIVAHDLLMTAVAVVASCYIRFEAAGIEERLNTLFSFLPAFVVYAGVVYFLFHLYEAKWRFASLPDLMNIVRASSVLAVSLFIVDYFLVAPNVFGQYFSGKITIALYWVPQIVLLSGSRVRTAISAIPARGSVRARRRPIRR
jgi:FlaA1/EpsC-like NDP-sugar epimerase